MPARQILILEEVTENTGVLGTRMSAPQYDNDAEGLYLELLLGLSDHVRHGGHVLRARDGKCSRECIIHRIMKNRIKRVWPLEFSGLSWIGIKNLSNTEDASTGTETGPEICINMPFGDY